MVGYIDGRIALERITSQLEALAVEGVDSSEALLAGKAVGRFL
jgi:hypothetical protein